MDVKTVAILTSEPPTSPGGVEHVVREVAKGLGLRGYEVVVLDRENAAPCWLRKPGNRASKALGDILISWYLGRKLRAYENRGLAAVISNGPVGWYVPSLHGKPAQKIHIYHGTYRGQAEAIRPFIRYVGYLKLKWWDSMIIERACGAGKLVFCNSDQTREEVRRFFSCAGTTTWLPLDVSHFRPLDQSNCRKELGLSDQGPVALFAGATHPMKGFPVIRALIRSLPGVLWLLALRGHIPEDLATESHVKVFADAPYNQLPNLYGAADFAVFPSRYEPFGYVVAEALACGTPVISSPGGASCLFLQGPRLGRLLIRDATNANSYLAAACDVLSDIPGYRQAVLEEARPNIVKTMAPENWWPRFLEATGL